MNDFSIDLETLHVRYNAAIIAIGCVQFDANTGCIGNKFYVEIDFNSAIKSGKVSGETLKWWMQQSDKAKRIFTDDEKKTPLPVALDELRTFILKNCKSPKDLRVFGNGATFDITILEHAYDAGAVGQREPWNFRNVRDMRTICDLAALSDDEWPARIGTHHNALDDATHQANCIAVAYQKIQRGLAALIREGKATKPVKTKTVIEEDEEL